MRKFRTLDEFEEEYLRKHPEEIDDYLTEIFQEYAEDNDSGALLASLRVVARVRGISEIAEQTGMTRRGLQKAFNHYLQIVDNFCDSKLDIPQTAEVPTNHDD
ncbi:DNA-binding protein [Nostoc sp. ChiVER01]|uniref:helix-turn-helix domain-containing transcriptional regulator n=1 Tax=Nostoc sp. ChiVER01 TaxID=3075382 RepID=UPI003A100236